MKNVKGNTSHWINENKLCEKFNWQSGYGAFSVGEIFLNRMINYIKNQKEHHKKETFTVEYEKFLKKYGFNK